MILRTVTGIDVAVRAVLIGERRIPDDRLVIATGARESYFGHNEWAAVTSGLKTIEDVTPMRRPILIAFERAESCADGIERQRQLTLVIIGGGPTGVELAWLVWVWRTSTSGSATGWRWRSIGCGRTGRTKIL